MLVMRTCSTAGGTGSLWRHIPGQVYGAIGWKMPHKRDILYFINIVLTPFACMRRTTIAERMSHVQDASQLLATLQVAS